MSKIRCVCGEVLPLSGEIPNPFEWLWISDVDYDAFSGQVNAEDIYKSFGHALRCPTSGHVWVFENGMNAAPRGYAPLQPDPE